MSELDEHLKIASQNLNRLLATIDDPDQGKFVSMLFNNIVNAISTVRMQCDALAERLEAVTPADRRPFYRREAELIVGGVIGRAGDLDGARDVLAGPRADTEIDPYLDLVMYEAAVRSILGDLGEAIELLRVFVAANPGAFQTGEESLWWWRPLRDDPRFQALLGRQYPR